MKKYCSNLTEKDSLSLININKADTFLLRKVLRIESLLSEKIIKYRNLLGGYYNNIQFKEISGIEDEQFNLLVRKVFIDTTLIIKININKTDERTLKKNPYLNIYHSKAILKYKNFTGEITSINELVNNKILSEDVFFKIRHYLSLD